MPYGIQQPAISGQISQLEKNLDLELFHRRPFRLTPAGVRLFQQIEPFFAGLTDLPAYIRGQERPQLRLAAPARILRDHLPEILASYNRRFADFKLSLFDANQTLAEELLRKGEVDLAITELGSRPGVSIQHCTLLRVPLVLVVPKTARFKNSKAVLDRQRSTMLIALPQEEAIMKNFQRGLRKSKLAWLTDIELSSLELVETYVSLGFGVGVSVVARRRKSGKNLRVLSLPTFPPLTIAALWMGRLSVMANSFVTDLKKFAKRLTGEIRV